MRLIPVISIIVIVTMVAFLYFINKGQDEGFGGATMLVGNSKNYSSLKDKLAFLEKHFELRSGIKDAEFDIFLNTFNNEGHIYLALKIDKDSIPTWGLKCDTSIQADTTGNVYNNWKHIVNDSTKWDLNGEYQTCGHYLHYIEEGILLRKFEAR
ncbi:MAG: hypothetical protein AAFZ63_17225 [Bacteroidota bacterium]